MTKQTRKTRSQEFFSTTVPALLRGMAVLLMFTHQAWADVVCCDANDIESHQTCEEHCSSLRAVAKASGHYMDGLAADAKPPVETCLTDRSQEVSWCCQFSLPAELQRPVTSTSNQTPINTDLMFFAAEVFATSAQVNICSSPPARSRPIFLITSCFII